MLWPALVIKAHTCTHKPVVMLGSACECACVCDTVTHCSRQSVCMNHYCACQCLSDYMCLCTWARLSLSMRVCLCACVPLATVGCDGWNVYFSAGPVRPLLLNICPLRINSSTLTHPSLPRDHLIEIHNDSVFSSLPVCVAAKYILIQKTKLGLCQLLSYLSPHFLLLSCHF